MEAPLQQTLAWQKLLKDLGYTTFWQESQGYCYLAELKTTPVGNYLYVPYGPCATTKQGIKKAYDSLLQLANEQKAIFTRVEPQNQDHLSLLKSLKAKKSHDLNPADTWVLDLTGDDDTFKTRLPKRLMRYHRTATNRGITIVQNHDPKDVHHLVTLQKQLAQTKKIGTFSEKYLATELEQDFATLYLAKQGQEILAAGLVFDDEHTRYNLQGAQNPAGAKLHATGILTIQLILDAREKGLQKFDFWGIAPEGAPKNHPWTGFTEFKKSFGGEAVHYCGTWDIINNPGKYHLYQALRKANRIKRKIVK